jgi:sulfotransferase
LKTIHFISGLPRSGSTLLANLLAQNPRYHVTGTSGIVDVMLVVRNTWDQLAEFKAMRPEDSEAAKRRVLRGMLMSYHPVKHDTVFDKARSWLAHLEMVEAVLGREVRVLVPVRDIRDVLASFEKMWRAVHATRQTQHESKQYPAFQSAPGRCAVWASAENPVGIAYNRVCDAFTRGLFDRLHLVRYEALTAEPAATMRSIYDFLDDDFFQHDFDNVEPVIQEDDFAYGFPGLHAIRRKVQPQPSQWEELLGEAAAPYGELNDRLARAVSTVSS